MQENPFDKGCRYLLKLEPAAMLAWLLGTPGNLFAYVRWIDTRRLPFPGQPDRICDTVAHLERLDANHRPWAIVVEFNIAPDPLMFGRVLAYLGLLWMEEKPAPERGDRFCLGAVQVNLTGIGHCSNLSDWPDASVQTNLTVRELNLEALDAAAVLQDIAAGKAPLAVLPWIPLMRGGNESGMIERWKEIAAKEPNAQRRADYSALAKIFAEKVSTEEIWREALKEWNMIESKFVKEWQDEARRDEGRKTLLELLRNKFGNLPADVPKQLESIEESATLRALVIKAAGANNLEDFQKHLGNGH